MKPVVWKLEVNHQWSTSLNQNVRGGVLSRLLFIVCLLVFQMFVVTLLLPVCLRLTQLVLCQSVRISALLTSTLVRISSQRHLSRDEGLK